MDQEFERRWRGTLPPFDGATVTPTRLLPLARLRDALAVVVNTVGASLPAAAPAEDTPLLWLQDWHEHDGYVREAEPAAWGDLLQWIESEESLCRASEYDDLVRMGFAPEGRDFYLRIYVVAETDRRNKGPYDAGTFDLTCGHALAAAVTEALRAAGFEDVYSVPPQGFFDRGYRGEEPRR